MGEKTLYTYLRKVAYHETDKMGVTHHANYIKWMEEARLALLDSIGLPFQSIESLGIVSPVTGISIDYKNPAPGICRRKSAQRLNPLDFPP